MSLVEKAIRKMQEGAAPPPSLRDSQVPVRPNPPIVDRSAPSRSAMVKADAGDTIVGTLVETAELRTLESAASGKRIEINRLALRSAGLMPPEHQDRIISDQYRQIKRPLIANAMDRSDGALLRNARLIMMASALPGDGKTFTSINLALSMSLEKDITVVLVDADVAKPHVSRVFGVDQEPGLLDALMDRSIDVESLVLPTDVPGLSILPAGRRTETATELLASARMEEVVRQLGSRYPHRITLFDSPPLLLTSESRVLAEVVGQVVLVVRAGKTPQQAVLDAISYLGDDQSKSIGLVLNQSEHTAHGGSYYGYGAYGGSGTSSGEAR